AARPPSCGDSNPERLDSKAQRIGSTHLPETRGRADWYHVRKAALGEGSAMKIGLRDIVFLVVALGGMASLAAGLLQPLERAAPRPSRPIVPSIDLGPIVERVNAIFRGRWAEQELVPAAPAPELAVMRRLALALCGTVPSLEEVRRFEA